MNILHAGQLYSQKREKRYDRAQMSDSSDDEFNNASARQLHRQVGDEFGSEAARLPLQLHGIDPFARLNLRPIIVNEQRSLQTELVKETQHQERERRRAMARKEREEKAAARLKKQAADDVLAPAAQKEEGNAVAAAGAPAAAAKKPGSKAPPKKPGAKRRQRASSTSNSSSSSTSSSDDDDDKKTKALLKNRIFFVESNPRLPNRLSSARAKLDRWSGNLVGDDHRGASSASAAAGCGGAEHRVVRLCSCCGRMARYRCPECCAGPKGSTVFADPDGGLVCSLACFDTHKQFRCGKHVE